MAAPLSYWDLPVWQQSFWRITNYLVQMLPGMALALTLFLLLFPWRKTRLWKKGLQRQNAGNCAGAVLAVLRWAGSAAADAGLV